MFCTTNTSNSRISRKRHNRVAGIHKWQRELSSIGRTSWRILALCIRINKSRFNHLRSSVKQGSMSIFSKIRDEVKWACGCFNTQRVSLNVQTLVCVLYPMWSKESSQPRWMLKKELWRQTTWVRLQPYHLWKDRKASTLCSLWGLNDA